MHILLLPSWYVNSYNGLLGIFFKEQAEALAKIGHNVGVIAIQGVGIRNVIKERRIDFSSSFFIENGVYTYRKQFPDIKLKCPIEHMKKKYFLKLFEQYIIDHGLPDIIHVHSYNAGVFAVYIKEIYHVPFVVSEHLSSFARNKISSKDMLQARRIYEKSEKNFAVSKQFKDLLTTQFALDFDYMPNMVNMDFFQIGASAEKDIFQFINIAFLDKNKNQEMLIKAFRRSFQNRPKIKLTIVGGGPEYDNLKNLIETLQMENQISLYGPANRTEVKHLLHASDAFVLSSRYETFGVVIIEAMACGLPAIATKCGGPESIIDSDLVGLLSEIDEKKLSEKLTEMYDKRMEYDSEYIRKYVERNFSEKAVSSKLTEMYKKVLT